MKVFLASLFAALLVAPALHAAEVVLEDDAVLAAFDSDSGALTRLEMADKVSPDFLIAGVHTGRAEQPGCHALKTGCKTDGRRAAPPPRSTVVVMKK
jgi:hypothetical protein